jgi:hypothetical protein
MRLATAVDYAAEILLHGNNVSFFPMCIYPTHDKVWQERYIAPDGVSTWYGDPENPVNAWGWEYAHHHFTVEKKINLKYLAQMVRNTRDIEKKWDGFVHSSGWGTLTHREIPDSDATTIAPPAAARRSGPGKDTSTMTFFSLAR